MSKKRFIRTAATRILAVMFWLAAAGLIWSYAAAPNWVAVLMLICAVAQLAFLWLEWAQYKKSKT